MTLTIQLPAIDEKDIDMELKSRQVKRPSPQALSKLSGWISLGVPTCIDLDPEVAKEDPELQKLLQDSGFAYTLVDLACTFKPPDGSYFDSAWLKVLLTRADKLLEPLAIAYSMSPSRLSRKAEFSRKVKIAPALKLLSPEVTTSQKFESEQIYLESYNEMQSDPMWQFRRVAEQEIRGSYRLNMIVRSPLRATIIGKLSLEVSMKKDLFRFFKVQQDSPDSAYLDFDIHFAS